MENTVNYLPQGRSLFAGLSPPSAGGVRFAQIAFSLPGRRSARLRLSRGVVTPLVLRLLFRTGAKWAGPGERKEGRSRGDGQQHEGEKDQAGDFGTMEMDIGVLERDREELKFRSSRNGGRGRRGWLRDKRRSENKGGMRVERERNRTGIYSHVEG